jgi:putative redox protein
MPRDRLIVARTHAELASKYRVDIKAGHHTLLADEPLRAGGADEGPAPYELLLSSLAACTAITLRMYAERKGWRLEGVEVDLSYTRDGDDARIDRTVTLRGELGESERVRLAEIAERTPVTLTLKSGVEIRTEFRQP